MMCENSVIGGRFRLGKLIGHGSFGQIYAAIDAHMKSEVAVKVEPLRGKHQTLATEVKALRDLQTITGVPKVYWAGIEGDNNVMVIELLGPSLEDMMSVCGRRMELKSVLQIAEQFITRLEHIHTLHYIHRDIKPENFLLGLGKRSELVHLIDFGLAKRFRDQKTHQHIPYKEGKTLTGTARYVSINTHAGIEQSRRDDLESVMYLLVYFFKGFLPWQGIVAKTKSEKYHKIMEEKSSVSVEELCDGMPIEVKQMLEYTRSLKFDEKPDYSFLQRLVQQAARLHSLELDGVFEWTPGRRKRSQSDTSDATKSSRKCRDRRKKEPIARCRTEERKDSSNVCGDTDATPRGGWPSFSEQTRVAISEYRNASTPVPHRKAAAGASCIIS